MNRPRMSLIAAAIVVAAGVAGLVRGAMPQTVAGASAPASQPNPIVISGAYVREPANGINAAAYFTVYNLSDTADTLETVASGAGAQTTLHTSDAGGGMQPSGGLTIPAHGSYSLTPSKGHVMIEKLYGPLKAGQSVNLQLTFARAGEVLVTAPVIGVTEALPTPGVPK